MGGAVTLWAAVLACASRTAAAIVASWAEESVQRSAPAQLICDHAQIRRLPLPEAVQCNGFDRQKALTFEAPEEFGSFWRTKRFPLTEETVRDGAIPLGYKGARRRWQNALVKLMGRMPLNVVVFGGSMTAGYGLANEKGEAWPARLQHFFQTGGYNVTVHNLGRRCTSIKHVIHEYDTSHDLLKTADVVIIDYGINDVIYNAKGTIGGFVSEAYALMLGLPQKPAVIDLETLTSAKEDLCHDETLTKKQHWKALSRLAIPTLYYGRAMCKAGRSFWMLAHSEQDVETYDSNKTNYWVHPGETTHDLVGHFVFGAFMLEAGEVCRSGITGAEHDVSYSKELHDSTMCLVKPKTSYEATRNFKPRAVNESVWEFKEDVPGKPGWVTENNGVKGDLVFDLKTKEGWLNIDFLGTYANIGTATVWMDQAEPGPDNRCTLHGMWESKVSSQTSSILKAMVPEGNHELHIRSDGAKFKLLGIQSC